MTSKLIFQTVLLKKKKKERKKERKDQEIKIRALTKIANCQA
jgi:hypothetical protein